MNKEITNLYDDYRKGRTDRREFLRKLAMVAGSSAAAVALLPALEDNSIRAATGLQDNSDLVTEFIKYHGETGDMRA